MTNSAVSIAKTTSSYGGGPPYSPHETVPEYPFGIAALAQESNPAYRGVREALRLLNLDRTRFGTGSWNPLSEIVSPGDTVVLKPNFVRDFRETKPGHDDCLITHGAVIRAMVDYVYIAIGGKGRIIIADAPQNDADFTTIRSIAGLDEIQAFYRREAGFDVEVYDLRPEQAEKVDGVIVGHTPLPGDPAGYVRVNLGSHSAFTEINHLCHRLYGAEYDASELRRHHHDDVHEYLISKTVLDADCVIVLSKLKTHKKTGLTCALKNAVGINGNKNWLPHHREGTPAQNGDQFPEDRLKHRAEGVVVGTFRRIFPWLGPLRGVVAGPLKAVGKRIFGDTNRGTIRSGNWHGNDTTWRMVLDLNRVLLYAGADGILNDRPARRFFCVVDGIVGGEGDGPLNPTRKPAGVILAGANPLAIDLACARLMGFSYQDLPLLFRGFEAHSRPITTLAADEVQCCSNWPAWTTRAVALPPLDPPFTPHVGWRRQHELPEREHPAVNNQQSTISSTASVAH